MASANDNSKIKVLVTGASGYLGIHCVKVLLDEGYSVRGTVRSTKNELKIAPLKRLEHAENLELVEADLVSTTGWSEAVKGCTYVLHVASPFVLIADESIIKTAVDGTLNVLRAAAKEPSVKKVVLTSSIAAIFEGLNAKDYVFTEKDWTDVNNKDVLNYAKSKTLAEKAAWDFVAGEDVKFKLTTINPVLIVGPVLHDVEGTSIQVIRQFLTYEMFALPNSQVGLIDVRDVARAHVIAMREPRSDGERIIMSAPHFYWFRDIADILRAEFGPKGYRIARLQAPYILVWLYSFLDANARAVLPRWGQEIKVDTSKCKNLLGMELHDPKDSLIKMAYDLIERGVIPKKDGVLKANTGD